MSEICFIDVKPRIVATGAETTVRLAGGGSDTPYYRDGQHYRAGVVDMPRFKAAFGFDDNGWTGGTVPTSGTLGFMSGDTSLIAALTSYYWRDAVIIIDASKEGAPLTRRLTGMVAGIASNEGQIALTLADPSKSLDKPLLGTGFTGEGGIEGPSEAAGRDKRRSLGMVFNIEGRLLDKVHNIHEFGDPAHKLAAFLAVRDKGREGPMIVVAWAGSIAATFAALQAAAAPQGGCAAAPSIACVKWWTNPAGPLTADIQGEIAGGYADTAVSIASRLLSAVGGPVIIDEVAADALRPATCGIHIASASDTVAQALDRLLLPSSLHWVLQPDGTIRIGEWAWAAPVASLQAEFIGRERQLPPVKSRKVGYRRNHRPHQDGEISAALPRVFIRATAPSAAESGPDDYWQDSDGRYWTRRGDNHLSIGGKRLMIGGKLLTITWTPNAAQPVRDGIDAALATAIAATEAAKLLALDAQATADGKIASFYRPAAPAGASVGDLWYDTANGNHPYRWNGSIWQDAKDGGIAAALDAAIAADDKADGKAATFFTDYPPPTNPAPIAEGNGDLWLIESTGELRRWSATGATWGDPLVDLTAAAVPRQEGPAADSFSAASTGDLDAGQLPKNYLFKRFKGPTDVSATATTWSIVSQAGITGGTVTVADGVVTIPDAIAMSSTATIVVKSARTGEPDLVNDLQLARVDAAAPPPPAGGTTASTSSFSSFTSSSFVAVTGVLAVKTGPAGEILLTGPLSVRTTASSPAGTFPIELKWMRRPVGGSFTDVGTAVVSSPDLVVEVEPPNYYPHYGSVNANRTATGLTALADYEVQLYGRRTGGLSRTIYLSGTARGTGS